MRLANSDVEVSTTNEGTDTLTRIEYLNIGGSSKTVDQWITDLTPVATPTPPVVSPTPPVVTPTPPVATPTPPVVTPTLLVDTPAIPSTPVDTPATPAPPVDTPSAPATPVDPNPIFADLSPITPEENYSGNVLANTLSIFGDIGIPTQSKFGSLFSAYNGSDEFIFDLTTSIRTSTMDFVPITSSANFDNKIDVFLDSLEANGYEDLCSWIQLRSLRQTAG